MSSKAQPSCSFLSRCSFWSEIPSIFLRTGCENLLQKCAYSTKYSISSVFLYAQHHG